MPAPVVLSFDLERAVVEVTESDESRRTVPFEDPQAFDLVSQAWVRVGWDLKYVYGFTWFGRPVIQLPEDLVRIQEVIYDVKPDVIVETGVAHGGSLVFYAGLCAALARGRVIGIDNEIRPANREAIDAHPLRPRITLVDGDSKAPATVEQVRSLIGDTERVLVILDSGHTKDHVLAELEAYSPLVSVDSYIVAADGLMGELVGAPRSSPDWGTNNPAAAVAEFAAAHEEFVLDPPGFRFNEGDVRTMVTYWRNGWLRRTRPT